MNTTIYQLTNDNGLCIEFIAQGGKVKAIKVPDKKGFVDIALGYDSSEEILKGDDYIGAICGRVANRIANGQFILDGETYKLEQNDRSNQIHGGPNGFQKKKWTVKPIDKQEYTSAFELSLISEDGDANYPGNLQVKIVYALNNQNEFLIDIEASTDKTTVVNLTSHPYFNLNGVGSGKIFNHVLEINADQYTPINGLSIPTGEIQSVLGSDLDFTKAKRIGDVINSAFEPIQALGGIDHNYVLNKKEGEYSFAGRLSEPESGRAIEVYTTQPGLQVYTAMHFDGSEVGKGQIPMLQYCGVALEAQNFPNAPNQPNFPSCILKPDEIYSEQIVYKFTF